MSWDLNEAFRAMNTPKFTTEVFHIEGELNVADGPSRDVNSDEIIRATKLHDDFYIPALKSVWHPYIDADEERPIWCI